MHISRLEWNRYFESLGARTKNHVSSKTDVLIVGTGAGQNKMEAAYKHGIPMISWPMCVYLGLADKREDYLLEVPAEELSTFIINLAFLTDLIYAKIATNADATVYREIFRGLSLGTSAILQSAWRDSTPVDQAIRRDGP